MAQAQTQGPVPHDDDLPYERTRQTVLARDARREMLPYRRSVLFVVHTVTGATRLWTVAELLGRDNDDIQLVFTQAPDDHGDGVEEFLKERGMKRVSWEQAVAVSERYDLAIAASLGHLHVLRSQVVLMPHGAGHHKLVRRTNGDRVPTARQVYGYDAQRLLHNGEVTPRTMVLSHDEQKELLAASCPEALDSAQVIGDPCYDQLAEAMLRRDEYRRDLEVPDNSGLVVVTSTWGQDSLLWRRPELFRRLVDELPADRYRVMAVLHPNEWARHGEFQLRSRFAGAEEKGLRLIPPDRGWQAAVTAADWVIGDQQGSVTLYATVTRATVLLGVLAPHEVAPGAPPERLPDIAPLIQDGLSLERQLLAATARRRGYEAVTARITSCPGEFATRFRRLVYDRLCLPEPSSPPRLPRLTLPW
ncbi:hypothetical protein ACIQPR_28900 [Streptomyces sp. NPDC091280]|uniref:hypothetical protein n=1 Tax=Streptomyces sp. NPDC091280 TaxID=3365984 RepID=UPI00380806A0